MAAFSAGFLREADDSLTVTTDATGALYLDGFLRSPTGALVVTTSTVGATMQDDFLRATNGALVVVSGGAGTEIAGFLRDTNLALVVASSGGTGRVAGFARDASLRLVVTGLATFTPASIAGLKLWLEADAGTSTTTDGAAISQWSDQSGSANHAVQATGANQPLYKAAIVNGKPVVRFDGVNDNLAVASAVVPGDASLFLVGAPSSVSAKGMALKIGNSVAGVGGNNGYGLGVGAADADTLGNNILALYETVRWMNPALTWGAGFAYLDLIVQTTTPSMYKNGVVGSSLTGTTYVAPTVASFIGCGADATLTQIGRFFSGDIAAVLAYGSVLSVSDRQSVENYLKTKYGL